MDRAVLLENTALYVHQRTGGASGVHLLVFVWEVS